MIKKFFKRVLNLFFPEHTTCNLCGAELNHENGSDICDNCESNVLHKISGKVCLSCGEPIFDMGDFCIRCKTKQPNYTMARASFVYDDATRKLIKGFKESGKKYIAKTLAFYMAKTYEENKMVADVITYVPMSKKRYKERGFNQAYLLAKELGEILKLEVSNSLVKTKNTEHQTGMNYKQRQQNLKDSFCVVNKDDFANRRVLLVDDVYTTGATVKECSGILLKSAKAKSVLVLTACHTTVNHKGSI